MTHAEIQKAYPPDFVARLANLVCSLADDESVSVEFALQVWSKWAPAAAMPLELFDVDRFGTIQ